MSDVTRILERIEQGDGQAAEELLPLVYDELRRLARRMMVREKPGQTLQPTALVHEAYLRLVDVVHQGKWDSRRHFFAAASEAMRRILVENARRKQSQKRGGAWDRRAMAEDQLVSKQSGCAEAQILAIHEALERLEAVDREAAALVKLRYFTGLTVAEAAEALGVSIRSAERLWTFAKAWLYREIGSETDH